MKNQRWGRWYVSDGDADATAEVASGCRRFGDGALTETNEVTGAFQTYEGDKSQANLTDLAAKFQLWRTTGNLRERRSWSTRHTTWNCSSRGGKG